MSAPAGLSTTGQEGAGAGCSLAWLLDVVPGKRRARRRASRLANGVEQSHNLRPQPLDEPLHEFGQVGRLWPLGDDLPHAGSIGEAARDVTCLPVDVVAFGKRGAHLAQERAARLRVRLLGVDDQCVPRGGA